MLTVVKGFDTASCDGDHASTITLEIPMAIRDGDKT
jgi:hypothetical protein